MNFKRVYVSNDALSKLQVCALMKDLANLSETGTLNFLSFNIQEIDPFNDENFDFPPTKVLWTMLGIPEHRYRWPHFIRKMSMADGKCAIIIKNLYEILIDFVKDEQEEILKILVDRLSIQEFESTNKSQYLEASEEEQTEMIRKFTGRNLW